MTANERRQSIYNLIKTRGFVTVQELVSLYNVSEVTIRKDLDKLLIIGTIQRVFGGVTYRSFEHSVEYRNQSPIFSEEDNVDKRIISSRSKISQIANTLIDQNDIIFLDSSKQSLSLATLLVRNKVSIHVFTNSLDVFNIIKSSPNIKSIVIGGDYDADSSCFMGPMAQIFAEKTYIPKVFFSVKGFNIYSGAEVNPSSDLLLLRTIAQNSEKIILLVHSSKFNKRGTINFLHWSKINTIITEQQPNDIFIKKIRESGINLRYELI